MGNFPLDDRVQSRQEPFDGLHAAVTGLEDLTVAAVDVGHFKALGVRAVNPLN